MPDISNRDDTIDSRDIEERIDDLESEQDGYIEDFESALEALDEAANEFLDADEITQHNGIDPSGELTEALGSAATGLVAFWNMEEEADEGETVIDHAKRLLTSMRDDSDDFLGDEELASLKAFREDVEGYCDWQHGATIIRESYFTEYCQELLADIGDLPRDLPGYIAIDWDKTADNLRVDYTEGEFDGVTYLVR